ncbi:soluble quino protein glucose dehydrogenase [Venturia nashicola]|uniref:Soluble quino protein glucose dehydrogenase n=1 Tax=Venturia nashicola TaxID=86259 RepID=A0A4Z1PEJ4_9PEZI|nr:soluble quino protein glucose dehydrogenase [Venturia nashicola]
MDPNHLRRHIATTHKRLTGPSCREDCLPSRHGVGLIAYETAASAFKFAIAFRTRRFLRIRVSYKIDPPPTRTLLLSRKVNGTLLVSRGSTSDNNPGAADISSARSQIKSFNLNDLSDTNSLDFASTGTILGWGLRNSVGVAEDPNTDGIFSVENSVDSLERNGQDGQNYGYPTCFAAWNVSEIPDNGALQVGSQFAIGNQNSTVNDDICANDRIAPRLTFPAHWAPLDIKFNARGDTAWITSHGSWNRDAPDGYLFTVGYSNGMPTAASSSTTAVIPIMRNQDNSKCLGDCFRPVGLAWDSTGRLFMTSDSTGEIYVVTRSDGSSVNGTTPATSPASPFPSPSPTRSAAVVRARPGLWLFVGAVMGAIGNVLG